MIIHKLSSKTVYYVTENGKKGSMELDKIVAACGHGVTVESHIKDSVENIINNENKGKRIKVSSIRLV